MGKRHEYTEEQIEYIKAHHAHSSQSDLARYCGVTRTAIVNKLEELGLSYAKTEFAPYSEEDLLKMRKMAADNKSLSDIADALDRSEESVMLKARRLKIAIKGVARRWSVEDMDTLRRTWGREPLSKLAKELKRDESAIRTKARKMKLPPCYLQSEDIPLAEFCRDTGIGRSRIMHTLVTKFGFPIKSMKPCSKQIYHYVDIEKIVPWLESHQSLYSAAGIPLYYFGEEPEWLVQKRKADFSIESETIDGKFKWEKWSDDDVSRLKDFINMGLSREEIASRLGRSVHSVKDKIVREGLGYSGPEYWRGSDFKAVREGSESKTDAEIAAEIGKTADSVAYHRRSIGISRLDQRNARTKEAEDYVSAHWKEQSDAVMARALGRSKSGVRDIRIRLGLIR